MPAGSQDAGREQTMSFLAPLFLLGTLAIAAPIIFHLIRQTSREKTLFSSLMFLLPTTTRLTRRSRLEHIFLLILRCLVLCLLALGFARPFLRHATPGEPGTGQSRKLVLLLDTSASMRRGDLWSSARAQAESILRKVSPADQVAVFTFDRKVNRLVTFGQWTAMAAGDRVGLTLKRLAQVSPGWSGTHLDAALIAAGEALEESPPADSPSVNQLVVISDFQEGSQIEGLQGYEWPHGIEVRLEPVKAGRRNNAGLQLVAEWEEVEAPFASVGPRVRVTNARDSQKERFQVGWSRTDDKQFIGPAIEVYVPPGQSRIVPAPAPVSGTDVLLLKGDDDDFDNAVYIVPPEADRVEISFVGNDSEQDAAELLYYLKRAFQQTSHRVAQVVARRADAPLPPLAPENTPLVIVADSPGNAQIETLRAWLVDGKTVLFVMKSATAASAVARLAGVETLTAAEAAKSGYAMLGQIDFRDPVFAPFADPRFSDFTKIHFWKYRQLDLRQLPRARALAQYDGGDPALIEISVGKGTLLVLTSGWQPADSQLALSSKFVPLLYSILDQAGGLRTQNARYVVGDALPLPERILFGGRTVTIRKPNGGEVNLTAGTNFSQTDVPGIYTITSEQPPVRFAVNLDPNESKTAPMATEELERLGVPVKDQAKPATKYVEAKRRYVEAVEAENQQKFWRWLLAAALVIVMMESGLAGWLSRRAAVRTGAET
jgi:hypothetical protein